MYMVYVYDICIYLFICKLMYVFHYIQFALLRGQGPITMAPCQQYHQHCSHDLARFNVALREIGT